MGAVQADCAWRRSRAEAGCERTDVYVHTLDVHMMRELCGDDRVGMALAADAAMHLLGGDAISAARRLVHLLLREKRLFRGRRE